AGTLIMLLPTLFALFVSLEQSRGATSLPRLAPIATKEALSVPPLEANRIRQETPAHLVQNFGSDAAKQWCLIEGKVGGVPYRVYLRHSEQGGTAINFYRGVFYYPQKMRMLAGSLFPRYPNHNCTTYMNRIHADWYSKGGAYRAAVDDASAQKELIGDVFFDELFKWHDAYTD
ncbi:hypothetical protein FOZ63_028029, partial [Perkinsus olseni]